MAMGTARVLRTHSIRIHTIVTQPWSGYSQNLRDSQSLLTILRIGVWRIVVGPAGTHKASYQPLDFSWHTCIAATSLPALEFSAPG
jgi:hypothetical protein